MLQKNANPEALCKQMEKALFDNKQRIKQQQAFKKIHEMLDQPASELAAQAIEDLLNTSPE